MSYFTNARARATRRKSPWNLLLIPAVFIPFGWLWWLMWNGLVRIHYAVHPAESVDLGASGVPAIFAAVAPLFAALPISMLIGNVLVRMVAPARRALDVESVGHPGTAFPNAQRQLLRLAYVLVPVALAIALLGALLSWPVRVAEQL